MGIAIKSSVDWEQALAGVAKTTNMSGSELNKMGNEITKMSNTMPFVNRNSRCSRSGTTRYQETRYHFIH